MITVTPWPAFVQKPAISSYTEMTIKVTDSVGGTDINLLIVNSAGATAGSTTAFPEIHVGPTTAGQNIYTSASIGAAILSKNNGPWFPAVRIVSTGEIIQASTGALFGDIHLYIGQSNAEHMWSQSSGTLTPNARTKMFVVGPGGGWATPTGDGLISFLNGMVEDYGSVSHAVIAGAVNGSAMTRDGAILNTAIFGGTPVQYWTDTSSPMWANVVNAISAVGGDIKGVIIDQGETDSGLTQPDTYFRALNQLYDNIKALLPRKPPSLTFGLVQTGFNQPNPSMGLDPKQIRDAQRWFVENTPGAYIIADRFDLPRAVDNQHMTVPAYAQLGRRMASGAVRFEYQLVK